MRKLQKVLEKYLWREKVKIESTKASISLHCASNGGTVLCDVFLLCLRWGPSDARLFFTVHMTSFPFSAQGKNHLKYIYIYIYIYIIWHQDAPFWELMAAVLARY